MRNEDTQDKPVADPMVRHIVESHKGIRLIIELWKNLCDDEDPTIRICTLMASMVGFIDLVMIIIFAIDQITGQRISGHLLIFLIFGGLLLFLGVVVIAMFRSGGSWSHTKGLHEDWGNIYQQKYARLEESIR